jgi:hypothetical protein
MGKPHDDIASDEHKNDSTKHIWWHTLHGLNDEFQMGLNFTHWTSSKPPIGLFANKDELNGRVAKSAE